MHAKLIISRALKLDLNKNVSCNPVFFLVHKLRSFVTGKNFAKEIFGSENIPCFIGLNDGRNRSKMVQCETMFLRYVCFQNTVQRALCRSLVLQAASSFPF